MKKTCLNIQRICNKKYYFPNKKKIKKIISYIFNFKKIEITFRAVDLKEIKKLNFMYRKKNYSTNVLSFKLLNKFNQKHHKYYLGDIIVCPKYIEKESQKLKKNIKEHWDHIIIHALLHLNNYHHSDKKNKIIMEKKENKILKKLGYNIPN